MPHGQLLQVAADVADAMAYLHLPPAVVTHRDLKSSNVLLDAGGRAVVCGMRPAVLAACSCSSAAACRVLVCHAGGVRCALNRALRSAQPCTEQRGCALAPSAAAPLRCS